MITFCMLNTETIKNIGDSKMSDTVLSTDILATILFII